MTEAVLTAIAATMLAIEIAVPVAIVAWECWPRRVPVLPPHPVRVDRRREQQVTR